MTLRAALCALVIAVFATACRLPYAGGARPITAGELDRSWYRAAETPVVRQRARTDCGLAALAMVAGAWGRQWSVDELSRQLPPSEKGVKLGALRDLARTRGLDAYAIRGTPGDLEHELSRGRPVLLGLLLPFDLNYNSSHYEVAVALDPRDGTVVTIDPASGEWRKRSRQVLDVEWKPAGYAALVVIGERRHASVPHMRPITPRSPAGADARTCNDRCGAESPRRSRLRASVASAWRSPSSTTRR